MGLSLIFLNNRCSFYESIFFFKIQLMRIFVLFIYKKRIVKVYQKEINT